MVFVRTSTIKNKGNGRVLYIPSEWGFSTGEWITVRMAKPGATWPYSLTTRIKGQKTGSAYINIPPEWPLFVGDMVDVKISYADIPRQEIDRNENAGKSD